MMLMLMLLVVLSQILPCVPGESSLVCHCKAGDVAPCLELVTDDAEKLREIYSRVDMKARFPNGF